MVEGLAAATPVPGRMEIVDAGPPFAVVVDYAHTPAALAGALVGRPRPRRRRPGGLPVRLRRGPRPGQAPGDGGGGRPPGRRGGAHLGQPALRGPDGHHRRGRGRAWAARPSWWWSSTVGRPSTGRLAWPAPATSCSWPARATRPPRPPATASVPFDDRVEARRALERAGGREPPVISLMTSGGVALWVAVLSTPLLIRWLVRHNIGQQIREDGPQVHIAKAGTPTMGGICIVGAMVVGYLLRPRRARGALQPLGRPGDPGRGRRHRHRLRRRLDQGASPPEPRAQQAGQVRRPGRPRAAWSRSWPSNGPTPRPPSRSPVTTPPA